MFKAKALKGDYRALPSLQVRIGIPYRSVGVGVHSGRFGLLVGRVLYHSVGYGDIPYHAISCHMVLSELYGLFNGLHHFW